MTMIMTMTNLDESVILTACGIKLRLILLKNIA